MSSTNAKQARQARHARLRKNLRGTAARPRLCVFRSLNHIYAQVIDDDLGRTLSSASTLEAAVEKTGTKKSAQAVSVGKMLAERCQAAGVKQVIFDRGGYRYHGRVKDLAEAARKAGLEF